MKTKIIPFNLEIAKKIQAGEIKGRVLDRDNFEGTIITTNSINTTAPIVIKFSFSHGDNILFFGIDGKNEKGNKLVLEVPDNEPQFKPFDKVFMRSPSAGYVCWYPHFYCCYNPDSKEKPYVALGGFGYEQCIPYEGNEHLLGTTDKPKEE